MQKARPNGVLKKVNLLPFLCDIGTAVWSESSQGYANHSVLNNDKL